MMAQSIQHGARTVAHRTRGHASGPVTRLVSPSDLGEIIKPFVFLDLAAFEGDDRLPIARSWHPHSGIATVTVVLEGAVRIVDTTGADLVLPKGGVEWMSAGNGVWHTGQAEPGYSPPKGHDVAWVAVSDGLLRTPSASIPSGEIAVFADGSEWIDFLANGTTVSR